VLIFGTLRDYSFGFSSKQSRSRSYLHSPLPPSRRTVSSREYGMAPSPEAECPRALFRGHILIELVDGTQIGGTLARPVITVTFGETTIGANTTG
jgi:hypothetical protein